MRIVGVMSTPPVMRLHGQAMIVIVNCTAML
jgi:hypothetical protein